MRLSSGKPFAFLLALLALASVALFLSKQWLPVTASQHAAILDQQLHWTLLDSAVLFVSAQLLLAVLIWTSQIDGKNTRKTPPRAITASVWLATAFIALEIFTAATLGRSAWAAMYTQDVNPDTVRVQALGQQFAFYFRYPGADGKFGPIHVSKIDPSIGNYFGLDPLHDAAARDDISSATLVLPVGRPVEIMLLAQDVIHGFYIREMRIQQDMVPGMEIPVRFTPTRIGKYEIACSQLCGLGHYRMRAFLQVVPEQDFQAWLRTHAH
ncbi:MAG: cytochrome C oxidase subunit II [Acidobacteria bacterium]|nr:cytochrome C oxidase subunit II [Acidobacteriota bacterium]MBV9146487.1 cytochrome C oxidase subunit II [Acidobacteriota bacterium]MBV9435830.1 cytochrome C oxidase subunit II [Acidobacteriota bacterium]